uniref:Uncharacterized protein n=1 Tax=Tetradesmus obliquus TaxID=3088 RepID=A0A383VRV0_TETOB|eukprot:jgi/Sobl393_1/17114/SZX68255.1
MTEHAASAAVVEVLPNLTPVSSPTAGAVDQHISNSMSDGFTNSGAMQFSRGAASEETYSSSSWSGQLSAAPEIGGWNFRRSSSTANSQQPRSRSHMRQLLQQHQQMQQQQQMQMQQGQSNSSGQRPPPARQDSRSWSSGSNAAMNNAAASSLPPVPPPPSRTSTASATATASALVPASRSIQMQQHSYSLSSSHLEMPGTSTDTYGTACTAASGTARSSSSSSSRAARAAALARMMTGSEGMQPPNFWVPPEQLQTTPHSIGGGNGSFAVSVGFNSTLQQQQATKHNHSAPVPGRIEQQQQLQLMQQAVSSRALGDEQLQQAMGSQQHSQALLSELDAQLLQLREHLESCSSSSAAAAAAAAAGSPALQNAAYMMGCGGFEACVDAGGMACVPMAAAAGMPNMPAADCAELLQLQAASAAESANKLAMLGCDAGGQPLLLLQHNSDPCLAGHRNVARSSSYDQQQQFVNSESMLAGAGGGWREARLSEVQQKMLQLADVQTAQRQLQEELLALLR